MRIAVDIRTIRQPDGENEVIINEQSDSVIAKRTSVVDPARRKLSD